MANTIEAGKQERKTFALFYEDKSVPESPALELIGKGIEELAIEQGAEVNKVKDVTGGDNVSLDSYEKTTAIDPIYIAGGVKFSELLDEIEEKNLTGDKVLKSFVWAKAYKKDSTGKYAAWRQDAVIELTSFGGDVKGVNAPCTLHWTGERVYGTFEPTKPPKFTPTPPANG